MNYLGRSIFAAAVVWIAFAPAGYSAERATSQDIACLVQSHHPEAA